MILFGKNVMIEPIEEDRSSFEKMIMEDNQFRARFTRWGVVKFLGLEVDLDIKVGDTVKFLSGTADYSERENVFIVHQEKIILRKDRIND